LYARAFDVLSIGLSCSYLRVYERRF